MLRIYIRRKGETSGHVFKSKFSVLTDKVMILPFTLVLAGIISKEEWSVCQDNICEKFGIFITEREIDGRSKLARNLESFSWYNALTKHKNRTKYHTKDEIVYKHKGNMYL